MANYMLIGAKELGSELFQVKDGRMTLDFKEEIARKLWDSYYVPYIKGYFNASGRFRSDDIRTGNLIGYVGSTASATYFPKQVIESDTKSHDITLKVLPAPVFEGSEAYAVQQGAGMVVTKASEEEEKASVGIPEMVYQDREQHRILCRFRLSSGDTGSQRQEEDQKL